MATVTGYTAERMLEIENTTVVDGEVQGDNLILLTREGTPIDAGSVRGPVGPVGPPVTKLDDIGDVNAPTPTNKQLLGFDLGTNMWIPSGLTLDDLTNVDATSPTANASLRFNAGTSRWVLGPEVMPLIGSDLIPQVFRIHRNVGSPSTSLVDGTGIIQLGANGGPNIGISQNVIQCRNGGAASTLYFQNAGGEIRLGGLTRLLSGDFIMDAGILNVTAPTSAPAVFNTEDPNGPNIILKRQGFDAARYGFISSAHLQIRNNLVGGSVILDAEPATGGAVTSPNGTVALQVIPNNGAPNGVMLYSATTYNVTTVNAANAVIHSNGFFYRTSSSEDIKTDIEPLDEEHSVKVLDLEPVWYRSLAPVDGPDWSYYGLIAEQVAEIDPRLVTWEPSPDCQCGVDPEPDTDEEGRVIAVPREFAWKHERSCLRPSSVQYDRLVSHLIHIAKDQKAKIDSFESRLAALEAA